MNGELGVGKGFGSSAGLNRCRIAMFLQCLVDHPHRDFDLRDLVTRFMHSAGKLRGTFREQGAPEDVNKDGLWN